MSCIAGWRRRAMACLLVSVLLTPLVFAQEQPRFMLGLDVFLVGYSRLVKGKRVALLTNQTGKDSRGRSTIDILHAHPDVNLVKLFSPEHGIRGQLKAGKKVADTRDQKTGLPIISLYGGEVGFRPKKAHLAGVDVLIYDIQDVGSRAYTYIWSMAEAMTACGEQKVSMIVFDRPCVFGADTVDGPICDTRYNSLLTRFAIPRVYGMTVGELSRYFNRKYNLRCHLTVIPMANYFRGMSYKDTGLKWTGPSPNIPDLNAAALFPATGTIGLCGQLHIGIHTRLPFQLVGAPWLDANAAAKDLNAINLPGVKFQGTSFVSQGFYKGKQVNAVVMKVTDPTKIRPATIELTLLMYMSRQYPQNFIWEKKRLRAFDRAMGTTSVRQAIQRGDSLQQVLKSWQGQHAQFLKDRQRYLIYKRKPASDYALRE